MEKRRSEPVWNEVRLSDWLQFFEASWCDTSGSSKQSSRQTNIRTITSLYLNTSHPVLIIAVWLNCRNWWHKTQCPTSRVCFPRLIFEASLHIVKNWVSLSAGIDVYVGVEAGSELRARGGDKYEQTQLGQTGEVTQRAFCPPSSIFEPTVHEWTPPNVSCCQKNLESRAQMVWS